MYNDKNTNTKVPFIFSKKLNNNSKIIPLKKEKTVLGAMKYFPPTNQEWSNSIYVYNGITLKNISIAQKNLTKLLKSYFNLDFSKNLLDSETTFIGLKRLVTNRIFFSKAELKHTSNKVIITLYTYNEEKRILINKLNRIKAMLYPVSNFHLSNLDKNLPLSLKKRLNLIEKEDTSSFLSILEDIKLDINNEIILENKELSKIHVLNIREEKLRAIKLLKDNLEEISYIRSICQMHFINLESYINIYKKIFTSFILEKDIALISHYKLLLSLNKNKFEYSFLSLLNTFISKIYNKEIEFNIVNLKALYLDSDIFTETISLKLKNRDNRLLNVLKSFLYMVKIRTGNVLRERYQYISFKKLWENKVRNLTIKKSSINSDKDTVNNLITKVFTTIKGYKKFKTNISGANNYDNNKNKGNLSNIILNDVLLLLKHKNMAGVRLEAKGRLTRRFTASRSVFKVKWKGSLKNIYSSYRGVSSVILRGHLKSNVQYSITNSKTRNGAFGLKGWISGK